jgi:hypothetical protein
MATEQIKEILRSNLKQERTSKTQSSNTRCVSCGKDYVVM